MAPNSSYTRDEFYQTLSHAENLSGSFSRELFGAIDDIKVHRVLVYSWTWL